MNTKEYQYYHNQNDRISAVVRMPEKDKLMQSICDHIQLKDGASIEIEVGSTFVHPKDQFCYKTGREQAKKKMQKFAFNVAFIDYFMPERYLVNLVSPEGVHLVIEVHKNRRTPYFIDIIPTWK
jgi:hypothetical protein